MIFRSHPGQIFFKRRLIMLSPFGASDNINKTTDYRPESSYKSYTQVHRLKPLRQSVQVHAPPAASKPVWPVDLSNYISAPTSYFLLDVRRSLALMTARITSCIDFLLPVQCRQSIRGFHACMRTLVVLALIRYTLHFIQRIITLTRLIDIDILTNNNRWTALQAGGQGDPCGDF